MNMSKKEISKMIDKAADRASERAADKAVKKYSKRAEQHMTDLKTFFSDEVKIVAEMVASKPSEERVREIVQEEIKPLTSDVSIIKQEVITINRELRAHNIEMKQLRKDYNSHNKRLTTIENMVL